MITGEIRNKIDRIWTDMWAGGIANLLTVIEQLTYLMFIRSLDEKDWEAERFEGISREKMPKIFPQDANGQAMRWSKFKNRDPREIYEIVGQKVFPFIKAIGDDETAEQTAFSRYMKDDMFGDPVTNEKGWGRCKVFETCSAILGGGTPSKSNSEYYNGDIPWVTPKDIKSNIIFDSIDHISSEAVANSSTKLIPPNAILMVIRSGILKHTLPLAVNQTTVAINQDMKAFITNDQTQTLFLFYTLKEISKHLLKSVRAVTADNIEFSVVKNFEVVLPPNPLRLHCHRYRSPKGEAANSTRASAKPVQQLNARIF